MQPCRRDIRPDRFNRSHHIFCKIPINVPTWKDHYRIVPVPVFSGQTKKHASVISIPQLSAKSTVDTDISCIPHSQIWREHENLYFFQLRKALNLKSRRHNDEIDLVHNVKSLRKPHCRPWVCWGNHSQSASPMSITRKAFSCHKLIIITMTS